jgi:hypothetical protein
MTTNDIEAYPNEPTKSTMASWDHLSVTPALNLTAAEISQLGLSTDSVQWPKRAGGVRVLHIRSDLADAVHRVI